MIDQGLFLGRKEIGHSDGKRMANDELELLFLLKHRNIIQLLGAYVQNDVYNLLFPLADMDLDKFLLHEDRVPAFKDDRTIFKAIHGLAGGLRYLHYFELNCSQVAEVPNGFLYGVHQDIKPRNILVRGNDFILADFGLSRLKAVDEGSQTVWKDSTFEYGAPECRNENTWIQGHIGRAADIWSLGCIISEVASYIYSSKEGVEDFRNKRISKSWYGTQRAFHDGTRLKEDVSEALAELARKSNVLATSSLFELLMCMFAENPRDRWDAKKVEFQLECIVLQSLVEDLLDCLKRLQESPDLFDCKETFRMESTRFRAWAATLGLHRLHQSQTDLAPQSPIPFSMLCETLENAMANVKSVSLLNQKELNGYHSLSAIGQCNNIIYGHLTKQLRSKADGLLPILFLKDASPQSLLAVSTIPIPGYENTCRIAAIKHMSSLFSKNFDNLEDGTRIDQSQIGNHLLFNDMTAHPEIYWFQTGNSPDQRCKVLVEWRDYGRTLTSDKDMEVTQSQAETMYRRMQALVIMLRKPMSTNLHRLECLGAFHKPQDSRFGMVYSVPQRTSVPTRLHYLLRGGGAKGITPPHIGQRFHLATSLAVSLQNVHLCGWVHKDLSSYNILFLEVPEQMNANQWIPYLVGFQYSREDSENSFTSVFDSNFDAREYQHPDYRARLSSFQKGFDYYSLGLVLLEIAAWECLSSVYNSKLDLSPRELQEQYIRICETKILERMGPIYCEATKACLLADLRLSGTENDIALNFQRLVIDKLESCQV